MSAGRLLILGILTWARLTEGVRSLARPEITQREEKCQQQLDSLKRLLARACEEDFQRHVTISEGGCEAEAEGVVSQGDYEIWSKSLVLCRKEKSRIILWSGLGSEAEREDVLWPLRRDGRGCIIHSRREPDTKLGEILNDPQVNVLQACPWSAVKPFWDGASRAFAGSWAARGGAQSYSIVLGQETVGRIFDTILYKAELKALAEAAQEGLVVDVLFTDAMSVDDQALVSSIMYHRTRLLSPMGEEEFDATTWLYGGCPKDDLASCFPYYVLEPKSTQLQRLIDGAKAAEAHYGGDAWRAARPKASVADGRCQQQLDALTALIAETCQEDANRGWPVSVSGCEAEAGNEKPSQRPTTLKPRTILLMAGKAQNTRNLHSSEAAGVVYLGDFEVWSKSLVACGEDKRNLLLWSGFKEEEREEVLWPLRSRMGGCALQTKAPEDTALAKLLNDERVKVLQDCPWKVTKPFWDGASRNFAGMWASRGPSNVIVAMGYHRDPGHTYKTMFNTVFYKSELKALAQASHGALTVRLVFTNPGMKGAEMDSATAVAFERARLISPLGESFKHDTMWGYYGCSDKKTDLDSCVDSDDGILFVPDSSTGNLGLMYWKGLGVRQDYSKAVELLEKSADLGNSVAMFNLGSTYYAGVGVQKNLSKALAFYQQAADLGDANSMFKLGQMNEADEGGKQNYTKAAEWFQKAVDLGWVKAMESLANMYEHGRGVQKNLSKSVELEHKAADFGSATAIFNLGRKYNFGEGVVQNVSKAEQLYKKAADLGSAHAMLNLGHMYYFGEGVQQNYTKAAEWLQEAADLGRLAAMNTLGSMYQLGLGVETNHSKAAQLFSKAADLGDAVAMFSLGSIYENGDGVEQNDSKAAELYRTAADLGNAAAVFSLGNMYHFGGEGVEQNDSKAAQLYKKAADLGNAHAMLNLGSMYSLGLGVEQNDSKEAQLYRKAADLGDAEAMFRLGVMYYDGRGLQENHTKAAEFYQRAADLGHVQAMLDLGEMYHEGDGVQTDSAKSAELFHKVEALQNLQ